VHDWAEGCEFFQRRDADEVTGVDHGIGLTDQLDASLGQATRASRHMGVGEDCDQTGTDSDGGGTLAIIVAAYNQLAEEGRRIAVYGASSQALRVLSITGLTANGLVFESADQAPAASTDAG
jgi:hypothetical protein